MYSMYSSYKALGLLLGLGVALLVPLFGGGCGYERLEDRACPPEGTALRWEPFGKEYLRRYCQGCHAEGARAEGHGVPAGYDFGTHEVVLARRERIFARAAGSNTTMPPGPYDPPAEEREKLAEWLACGAP
jgi:hypothetical protein